MVDDDAFASLEAGNALADSYDGAGHLMAKDAGGRVGAGVDFFEISAADTAGGNFNEQFAGADGGHGNGLDTHVVDAAVDYGAHSRGDPVGDVAGGVGGLGSHPCWCDLTRC